MDRSLREKQGQMRHYVSVSPFRPVGPQNFIATVSQMRTAQSMRWNRERLTDDKPVG